ncbi:MAG: ABC transporter permease [Thermoanaerobaculia bacterium]|nr:ABC transporter permease [Thermoanaerobaculia bacterium]
MRSIRLLRTSLQELFAHRLRASLALLGNGLGIASVLVLIGIGEGARQEVVRGIESFGADLLVVKAGKVQPVRGRVLQPQSQVSTLTVDDAEAITAECPEVSDAVPVHDQPAQIKFGQIATPTTVVGTLPPYFQVRRFTLVRGRTFSAAEERASRRVAVLGATVSETLFGGQDPLGEIIRVGRVPFEVIGVLQEKGVSPDGADEDDQIVVPLRAALRRVFQENYVEFIYAKAHSSDRVEPAEAQVRQLLRRRHRLDRRGRPDDFEIQNLLGVMETRVRASESFTLMVGGVASLSLLVGGFGILSVMLLSTRERCSEIGLRMAVGARRRDILGQFLGEALVLGVTGGVLGVGVGLASAAVVGRLTRWSTAISHELIVAAVAFSMAVGLVFGVIPALRAAGLDPIEALRRD